ncbi:ArsR/SmtB family transcription factor [Nocardioides sp. Soil796]|nr:metalloregulator ArsR/SmtB family transcription factor [Nocardioides sp. Soil796]
MPNRACGTIETMSLDLARIGRAIGAPARAAMIDALFDGAPHTAGQLAHVAGVAPATASQHLALLADAGLVTVEPRGRFRHYRLANARVAHALEQLSGPGQGPVSSLRPSREQRRLRAARTCYDHLAGQLGVAVAERFIAAAWTDPQMSTITPAGTDALETYFGVDLDLAARSRRPLVRPCRDWTEQRDHLAGTIGTMIATAMLTDNWVNRQPGSRALSVTPHGIAQLERAAVTTDAHSPVNDRTG